LRLKQSYIIGQKNLKVEFAKKQFTFFA